MKQLKGYIQSAWYNIRHHKAYALFCLLGSALTFVFITIALEITYSVTHNVAPYVYGERMIYLSNSFENTSGQHLRGINTEEIPSFLKNIKDLEGYALANSQGGSLFKGDLLKSQAVTFVSADFWKINRFKFIAGRPFTPDECETQKPVAVIKKNIAENFFKKKAIGQKFEFQKNTYTIIGVVDDYSTFATDNYESVWVPCEFNRFVPNNYAFYDLYLLFSPNVPIKSMKEQIVQAVKFHFKNKNQEVDINPEDISTLQEDKLNCFGSDLLTYGVPITLFFLLIIPAINIVTLSIANTTNRAQEIAIRRAMGANRLNSFIQIITENLLLVLAGTFIGLLLTYPITDSIEKQFLNGGQVGNLSLISHLDYGVVFGAIIPLSFLFSLLSGGIPAYLIAKRNIAETLKGGSK